MDLIVALEHRFARTPDGRVWTQTMFAHSFWSRYLEVFERVGVVARVRDMTEIPSGWERADGVGIVFKTVPYYVGPWQYLLRSWGVRRAARNTIGPEEAVILRVPSRIASCIDPVIRETGRPYGVEVVGDPYDVFSPGAIRSPLRPFFRWWSVRQLRRQCADACAAAYVTEKALQSRYPPAANAYAGSFSDVEFPMESFALEPRQVRYGLGKFNLIHVGSMEHLIKAQDVLVKAVANCVGNGLDIHLLFVGDGKYRGELESRAAALGLKTRVHFTGWLPAGAAVREQLDKSDLFVLPSRAEGLPRAMLEAMTRGLPCIGSSVGGIPELLPREDLAPPNDATALAAKIKEVLNDPERMSSMSARNLEKAKEYRDDELSRRRLEFYHFVRGKTEEWLKAQGR